MFYEKERRGSERNNKIPQSMMMTNQSENSLRSPLALAFWNKHFPVLSTLLFIRLTETWGTSGFTNEEIHMLNWNSCFPKQRKNEVKQGPPTQSGSKVVELPFFSVLFLGNSPGRNLGEDGSPWVYHRRASRQCFNLLSH